LEDDPFPPIVIGSRIGRGPLIGGRGKEKDFLHWPKARNSPSGDGKLLEGVAKKWGCLSFFH
jgi:hypothetical protein